MQKKQPTPNTTENIIENLYLEVANAYQRLLVSKCDFLRLRIDTYHPELQLGSDLRKKQSVQNTIAQTTEDKIWGSSC